MTEKERHTLIEVLKIQRDFYADRYKYKDVCNETESTITYWKYMMVMTEATILLLENKQESKYVRQMLVEHLRNRR